MIKKVIRIENLGCLRKLEPGPGVGQAGKLVGIFAENGSGKTTLVAALRAAHEGTVEPLQERQSLPLAGSPIVELLTSAGTVKHSAEERGVVRCPQLEAHQPDQRGDEAFGLAEREVVHRAQGQCRQDRQIGVAPLSAGEPG